VISPEQVPLDTDQLVGRFPRQAALIVRLLVQDEAFRAMCEDWVLAKSALATQLEGIQSDQHPAKIADYRRLVAELEEEILDVLAHAGQPPRSIG
jgi:hypothetical protein